MNPERLLAHFDRVSESPDAMPRLRRFILDLAVKGQLVEQDPRDEPASDLLKRIEVEKSRSAGSDGTRQKALPPVSEDALHFVAPSGWCPTRLGRVAGCLDYMREPVNGANRAKRIAGKLPSELFPYFGATQQQGWIDDYIFDEELVLLGEDGVPFLDPLRPKAYLISGRSWVNNHAHVFRGILVSNSYLILCLNAFDYTGRVAGATRSKLNQSRAIDIPIVLPPLPEQLRIVAKVDELMALCDQLEAAQAERERRRDRVAVASLHRLDQPVADATVLRAHAEFHLRHLPRLATHPEHVQRLRQNILNLAVRGRLVPQDPMDESASELLARVRAGRIQVGALGKRSATAQVPALHDEGAPFALPSSWCWVRFGELFSAADAGWSPKSEGFPRTGGNWGVLKVSAVSWDRFLPEENKQLLPGVVPPKSAQVRQGDFLISRANTSELVAKCVVVQDQPANLILSDKIVRLRIVELCNKTFICIVNNHAEYARAHYAAEASGTSLSMKNVSRAVFQALPIPLPPLAEQLRIVAKVDELMTICDHLEAQLTAAQTESRRLLEAILHEALAPAA